MLSIRDHKTLSGPAPLRSSCSPVTAFDRNLWCWSPLHRKSNTWGKRSRYIYSPLSIQTGRMMGKKTVTRLAIVSKGSKFGEKRPLEVERLTDCYVMLGRHELGTKFQILPIFGACLILKSLALGSAVSPFHMNSSMSYLKMVASPNFPPEGGGKKSQLWEVMEHINGTSTIHGRSMSYWKGFFCQLCWIYQKCNIEKKHFLTTYQFNIIGTA